MLEVGGGVDKKGISFKVGFQPHEPRMVIFPTASWIQWCMKVRVCGCRCGELIWSCFV